MPTTIYRSASWHVQSFGTDHTISIAALDDHQAHCAVWVIPGALLSDAFRSRLEALNAWGGDWTRDAFLSGFTLAASSFQLEPGRAP